MISIKKIITLLLICFILFSLTACSKEESLENDDSYEYEDNITIEADSLQNYGFQNLRNSNVWIEVEEYNTDDESVVIDDIYSCNICIFSYGYYTEGVFRLHDDQDFSNLVITSDMLDRTDTQTFTCLSNDAMTYRIGANNYSWIITNRYIFNDKIVLEVLYTRNSGHDVTKYYTLTELLDFNNTEMIDNSPPLNGKPDSLKVYFK